MIKTIIFDFGDIFINLDKHGAREHALDLFGIREFDDDLLLKNADYEKGTISTGDFIGYYRSRFPEIREPDLKAAWNLIIKDFPAYRLKFLKDLRINKELRFILLSNTNEMHIDHVKETVPFYDDFKDQFDRFYLSHKMGMRKPELEIYQWVLNQDKINADECLFIDDTLENIQAARELGINTWNLNPELEDIIELTQKFVL